MKSESDELSVRRTETNTDTVYETKDITVNLKVEPEEEDKSLGRVLDEKKCSADIGENPYECDWCGKVFVEKSNLTVHLRTHSGEKPYGCDCCGRSFRDKTTLRRHLWTHAVEKPYECERCGKQFDEKCFLTQHLRTHAGEKPYECDSCGKQFGEKYILTRHSQTHVGEKSYECDRCEKSFRFKSTLKQHLRVHAEKTVYRRIRAGKVFGTRSSRKQIGPDKDVCTDRTPRTERKSADRTGAIIETIHIKTEEIRLKTEPDDEYFRNCFDGKETDLLETKPFERKVSFARNDDPEPDTDEKTVET